MSHAYLRQLERQGILEGCNPTAETCDLDPGNLHSPRLTKGGKQGLPAFIRRRACGLAVEAGRLF